MRTLLAVVEQRLRNLWLLVFVSTSSVFLLTAHWSSQNTDTTGAALPAWHLVHRGTVYLDGLPGMETFPGVMDVHGHLVMARTAGVLLAALLGQLPLALFDVGPAPGNALAAALFGAATVANVAVLLRPRLGTGRAVVSACCLAFGTGVWTLASAELWSHSPDLFFLSLAAVAFDRDRYVWTGAALGGAILCRPHLAVAAAVIGVGASVARRSLLPALEVGVPATVGLVGLLLFNTWYFDRMGIAGGYGYAVPQAVQPLATGQHEFWIGLAGTLAAPSTGVLVYTPLLVALVPASLWARKRLTTSSTVLALAGLAYLLVQVSIDGGLFDGGSGFYGNRYALEAVALATPLLAETAWDWTSRSRSGARVVCGLASVSVGLHLFGVLMFSHMRGRGTRGSWTTWYPWFIGEQAGSYGLLCAGVAAWVVLTLCLAAQALTRPDGLALRVRPASPRAAAPAPS